MTLLHQAVMTLNGANNVNWQLVKSLKHLPAAVCHRCPKSGFHLRPFKLLLYEPYFRRASTITSDRCTLPLTVALDCNSYIRTTDMMELLDQRSLFWHKLIGTLKLFCRPHSRVQQFGSCSFPLSIFFWISALIFERNKVEHRLKQIKCSA